MRKNELRKIIADGKTVLNAWLAIANPFSAELMAHQGFDAVTIDLQHGPVDFQAAVGMLAAISTTPAVPMVRVPWNEPILTAKLLDAGAYGVICPMINSKAEAEALVGACRYPPRGASAPTARFSMAAPTIGSTRMTKFSSSPWSRRARP